MGLGGLPSIGNHQGGLAGQNTQGGNAGAGDKPEFALEQHSTSSGAASQAAADANSLGKGSKIMKIIDKKKKNRKGAPRTMLVDGEIWEVFLLAIA